MKIQIKLSKFYSEMLLLQSIFFRYIIYSNFLSHQDTYLSAPALYLTCKTYQSLRQYSYDVILSLFKEVFFWIYS